jgi:serine/threonine protein kinase
MVRYTSSVRDPSDDESEPPASLGSKRTEPGVPSFPRVEAQRDLDPRIGTTLGDRYVVLRRIGQGGMARVYVAKHKVIGRLVAIKVLFPHLVEDQLMVRRFVNEARAAGMIGHPNIVESVDIGTTDDGLPFLVLEYLEGKNLQQELRENGTFSVERAVGIALQVASALGAAHAQSIIHRDLKSENVFLVERDGRADHVKVLDFGVARFAAHGEKLTAEGATLGTPECMAPEQLSQPDTVDLRIDVWALGILLYELLAGQTPFHDVAGPAILYSIMIDKPKPLHELRSDVPPGLDAVVQKALAKKREDRHASMDAMYAELLPFAGASPPPRFVARPSSPDGPIPASWRPPVQGVVSSKLTPAAPAMNTTTTSPQSFPQVLAPPSSESRSTVNGTSRPPSVPAARPRMSLGAMIGLGIVALAIPIAFFATRPKSEPGTANPPPTIAATTSTASTSAPSTIPSAPSASTVASTTPTTNVALAVLCPLPGARVTFRGKTHPLPFTDIVAVGQQSEAIEVTASGHEGRRYFVLVDHAMSLSATLPPGKGIVVDATQAELDAAIGGAAPAPTLTGTKVPSVGSLTKPPMTATSSSSGKPNNDITLER